MTQDKNTDALRGSITEPGAIIAASTLVGNTLRDLKKYWNGELRPAKTGQAHFDEHMGGLLPQEIVILGGASGMGKTLFLQRILHSLGDVELNPQADDYRFLNCNWEMTVDKLFYRAAAEELGLSIKELLAEGFEVTKQRRASFKKLQSVEGDSRISYMQSACTPAQFKLQVEAYLKEQMRSKHVFITIDHAALVRTGPGSDKKTSVDLLIEACNDLKKTYKNVSFIILTQLNREILRRSAEASNESAPNRGDLYASDTMFQAADYVIIRHIPAKLNIEAYMSVPTKFYERFKSWMVDLKAKPKSNSKAKKSAFITEAKVFYHYLKVRESGAGFTGVHVESMYVDSVVEEVTTQEVNQYREELDVNTDNDSVTSRIGALVDPEEAFRNPYDDEDPDADMPF